MFLFDGEKTRLFYTGDMRAKPWYVNSLSYHPSLSVYFNGMSPLDYIYADATFGYRGEPYIDILSNI